jgi:DNA-binding MarR family transcriptional regulator
MTTRSAQERFVVDQPGGNIALDLFVLDQHLGLVLDAALAPTGVTASAYAVYGQLALAPATPGKLSETLGIRPTTLSGYLSAMERSGHVSRVRNEQDGRSWLLELSEPGRAKADECRQVLGRVVRSINAGIGSADEVRQVRAVLARLDRAVTAAFPGT